MEFIQLQNWRCFEFATASKPVPEMHFHSHQHYNPFTHNSDQFKFPPTACIAWAFANLCGSSLESLDHFAQYRSSKPIAISTPVSTARNKLEKAIHQNIAAVGCHSPVVPSWWVTGVWRGQASLGPVWHSSWPVLLQWLLLSGLLKKNWKPTNCNPIKQSKLSQADLVLTACGSVQCESMTV